MNPEVFLFTQISHLFSGNVLAGSCSTHEEFEVMRLTDQRTILSLCMFLRV